MTVAVADALLSAMGKTDDEIKSGIGRVNAEVGPKVS